MVEAATDPAASVSPSVGEAASRSDLPSNGASRNGTTKTEDDPSRKDQPEESDNAAAQISANDNIHSEENSRDLLKYANIGTLSEVVATALNATKSVLGKREFAVTCCHVDSGHKLNAFIGRPAR